MKETLYLRFQIKQSRKMSSRDSYAEVAWTLTLIKLLQDTGSQILQL